MAPPPPVLYVNSTLPAQQELAGGGRVSSIHYWSFRPQPHDVVLAHRRNRWEIHLRARLRTFDPHVAVAALRAWRRVGCLYLVTQPDLVGLLPWLRRRPPGAPILTWVWSPDEVDRWWNGLQAAGQVLALTEAARDAARDRLPSADVRLGLWECDPDELPEEEIGVPDGDVLVIGRTDRDHETTAKLVASFGWVIRASPTIARKIVDVEVEQLSTEFDAIDYAYRTTACSLILLERPQAYPVGYTNLSEALCRGCPVVMDSHSTIPKRVLDLPGVFLVDRDRPGWEALVGGAVEAGRDPTFRSIVRDAAVSLLASGETSRLVRRTLELGR